LETPDISTLAESAGEVIEKQNQFPPTGTMRAAARKRAEAEFSLDKMVDSYLKVLLED
jgi:hypothetical protein